MGLSEKFKNIGIEVEALGELENKVIKENNIHKKQILLTGESIKYSLAEQGLIPARYIDLEFDVDALKDELKREWSFTKMYSILNFNSYINTVSTILNDLRVGKLPDRSYLIGFYSTTELGNTAFAVNAIKLMYAQGMSVVPFVSGFELSEVLSYNTLLTSNRQVIDSEDSTIKKILNSYNSIGHDAESGDERGRVFINAVADTILAKINTHNLNDINSGLSNTAKDIIRIQNKVAGIVTKVPDFYKSNAMRFSWDEYVNADLAICWIGIEQSIEAESKAVSALMESRSAKGKPTICLISKSLALYKRDANIYRNYWSEMDDIKDNKPRFNRFTHVSCYKRYSNMGKVLSGIDDTRGDLLNQTNEFDNTQ